jgi:hypothetical protein
VASDDVGADLDAMLAVRIWRGDAQGHSTYTRVRAEADAHLAVEALPVAFTQVRPGEPLI